MSNPMPTPPAPALTPAQEYAAKAAVPAGATAIAVSPTIVEVELPKPPRMTAPKTLVSGVPGAGKSTCLATYIKAGIELFAIVTEPGGEEVILEKIRKDGLDINKFHWHYIPTAAPDWATMIDMAKTVNTMSYESQSSVKQGGNKGAYRQFMKVLEICSNFKCERTGQSYGPIDKFDDTRAVAFDSLSGLSTMAMDLMMGTKLAAHQGEWGVAMNFIEKFLNKITSDVYCHVAVTAHVEREIDEVGGQPKNMVSTLGKKLAPKIPKMFSDVVLAKREGAVFNWSTNTGGYDLKSRLLPLSDKLEPDFGQLVRGWEMRKKLAAST